MTKFVVAAYDVGRAYGGPEEGGWWYDVGSHVRTLSVHAREEEAYERCRRLNRSLNGGADAQGFKLPPSIGPNVGRSDPSSVACNGWIQAEVHEDHAPAGYPDARPHYE